MIYVDYVPIASTMDTFIEGVALIDGPPDDPIWTYAQMGQFPRHDMVVDAQIRALNLSIVREASDAYRTWWWSDTLRVCRQVRWDGKGATDLVWVYAQTLEEAQHICDRLRAGYARARAMLNG